MGQVGYRRADHRQHLHREHYFRNQWRLLQQQACGFAERLSEGEPRQIADHHEHHKAGLPKFFRRAHLKDVAENEGVDNNVYYRCKKQPKPATNSGRKLPEKVLSSEVLKQSAVDKGREQPLV